MLDRKFREKDVINIKKNNIKFPYEAENHMRFNIIKELIYKIYNIKNSNHEKKKLKFVIYILEKTVVPVLKKKLLIYQKK